MTANQITVIRPLLSFRVLLVLGRHPALDGLLCIVIVGIFALDALDGYLARKRKETSKIGEILDTLADRMIENTFWIYFTPTGQLPVWMPIVNALILRAQHGETDAFSPLVRKRL